MIGLLFIIPIVNYYLQNFVEGDGKESLRSYITRENWSETDIYLSNMFSIPSR